MHSFSIEQALFRQSFEFLPAGAEAKTTIEAQGHSPGFHEDWTEHALELIHGFGDRPAGVKCPLAVFAQPFADDHVAVVQVADQGENALGFHFLVLPRADYAKFLGDPFYLANKLPAPWQERGSLPTFSWPRQPSPPRTVDDVCQVLKRLKAGALSEDWEPPADEAHIAAAPPPAQHQPEAQPQHQPEAQASDKPKTAEESSAAAGASPARPNTREIERTVENSESPALLGGTQVLVDGGRVYFKRAAPDPNLIQGLWMLLPTSTRCVLWPASFAFSNQLQFDAVALPRPEAGELEGYTSEEQAIHYPEGRYELSLQTAAESGDQHELDRLLGRRSVWETRRLGLMLLALMIGLVLISAVFEMLVPKGPPPISPEHRRMRAAAVATIVGTGDPWTAIAVLEGGKHVKIKEEGK